MHAYYARILRPSASHDFRRSARASVRSGPLSGPDWPHRPRAVLPHERLRRFVDVQVFPASGLCVESSQGYLTRIPRGAKKLSFLRPLGARISPREAEFQLEFINIY